MSPQEIVEAVVGKGWPWNVRCRNGSNPETEQEKQARTRKHLLREVQRYLKKMREEGEICLAPDGRHMFRGRPGVAGGTIQDKEALNHEPQSKSVYRALDDLLLGFRRVDPALRPHLTPLQQAAVKDMEDVLRRIAEKGGPDGEWVRKNRPDLFEEPTSPRPEDRPGEAPAG